MIRRWRSIADFRQALSETTLDESPDIGFFSRSLAAATPRTDNINRIANRTYEFLVFLRNFPSGLSQLRTRIVHYNEGEDAIRCRNLLGV
jgi:hypothetical protein